jgi:plastocyanin
MSTLVELKLDNAVVNLGPGEAATLQISLTNTSNVVDAFRLTVLGLDAAWYTLVPAEVSLFPHKSSQVQLRLHLPRGTYAGPYPFTILATSRDNPLESSTVGATVNLAAEGGAALGIEPKRIKGRAGLFAIAFTNGANTPRRVMLSVTDPDEALRYTLGTPNVQQAAAGNASSGVAVSARPTLLGKTTAQGDKFVEHELEVPAGSTLTIPLQVKPLKRVWAGRERVFLLQAGTHPPGVGWEPRDAQKAQAELAYRPIFAAWSGMPLAMRRLLAIGIPLLLLLLIFWLLLRPPSEPPNALAGARATQTAQAVAAQQTQTAIADQLAAAQNDATRTVLSALAGIAATNATQTAQANANVAASTQTTLAVASATAAAASAANGANGASDGIPSINRFWLTVPDPNTADPSILRAPNLEWDVTDAASVRVTEANLPFALGGLDTASQVEYQLIVTGTNSITGTAQVVTSTMSVIFIRPPLISALNVSQATINAGGSTSLSWQAKGARSATLDGVAVDLGPGGVGSLNLSPTATHRYILCVSNQAGTVCRSVKVTVIPAGTPIPTNTPAPVTPSPTPCTLDYSVTQQSGVQMVPGVNDIGNHCDNCTTSVGLPFSFKLYEQTYTSAIVGSNGTIGFVSNTNPITNTCFPNPQLNYAIMPHWDDLTTNGPGLGVFTSVSGNAPNRIFNIEWRAARGVPITANRALLQPVVTPSAAPPVNFVVRLYENSPVQQFDVIYGRVDDLGNGATIGVQRGAGSNFTQYACNTSDIEEGLQLTFLLSCGTSVPPTPSDGGGKNTLTCGPSIVDIRIVNGAPQPRNVTVNVGTTVRWINLDAAQHSFGGVITGTVAGSPGTTPFNSGVLNQGTSFQYTFTTPGVFTYSSPGDPNLTGTITVVVACTPTPSSTITATPTGTTIAGTAGPTSTDVPILIGTATTISSSTSEPTSTAIQVSTPVEPSSTPIETTTTAVPNETSTAAPPETATLVPTNTPEDDPPPTSPPQRTATRTASRTITRTATRTATRTVTPTVTRTVTQTVTRTATRTSQATATPGCAIFDYAIQNATGAIVSGTTNVGNNCNNCTSSIALPFPVTVYGQTFTSVVNASSNGNLQFAGSNTDPNNVCLPYAGFNTSIMPYWDDLTTDCSGCGIFTSVSGSPGNRIFDIEWRAQAVSTGPEIVATPTVEQAATVVAGGGGLVTQDLSGPLTPEDLANILVGSGVTISNVAFQGADVAGGTFNGAASIIGFSDGVILGSGNINSVVGPNMISSTTTINNTPGDPDLEVLASHVTSDAAVLEFDFVPAQNTLTFDYVFSSEEYNEYVGSSFNDVFAFFVNGNDASHNCALVGESPVSVNTINLNQNSEFYRDNDSAPNAPINTEMDGLTTVLACLARVEPGVTNHMKLAIADVSDAQYDSNVFLKAGSVSSGPTATPSETPTATETSTATNTPTITPTASPTPARVNFEVRLFENSAQNRFDVIYASVSQGGNGATIGVQEGTGARYRQYSCDTNSVSAGTRLIFTYGCLGTTTPTGTTTGTSTTTRTPTNTATATYTPRPTNTPTGPNCIVVEDTSPLTYPPLGVITSTIFVPISGTIADLNVFDLHITRNNGPTNPMIVLAELVSPNGTPVTLFNWGCKPSVQGSTDRMFITLDSEAATSIPYCTDQVIKGTYQPDQSLAVYNNVFMPAGTWTLRLVTESQRRKGYGGDDVAGARPVAELLSYRKLYKTVQLAAASPTAEGKPTVDPSAELSPEPTLAEPTPTDAGVTTEVVPEPTSTEVKSEPTSTETTGKATSTEVAVKATPTEYIGRATSTPTYDPAKSTTTVKPEGTVENGRATATAIKGAIETPTEVATDTPTEAPTETPTSVVGLPPPMGGTPTGTPNPNGGTLIRWGLQICFLPATATPTATATASATPCPLIWRTVPSPNSASADNFLLSVDTVSTGDAWAVGFIVDSGGSSAPLALHWNGTVWNNVTVPNPGNSTLTALHDVVALAPNDVWAVGYFTPSGPVAIFRTFIIHWDGTAWSVFDSPNPGAGNNVLNGISGIGGNLWAVGNYQQAASDPSQNLVLRYTGSSWIQDAVLNPGSQANSLDEVAVTSDAEVWAVGWQSSSGAIQEGVVLRRDMSAGTWTLLQSPTSGVHSPLHDVAVIAPGQVWAVGEYATGSGAITWRCTTVSCTDIASPGEVLYGVTTAGKALAWAVGRDDNNLGLIIRWDGGSSLWTRDVNAPPGFSSTLYAVDALSDTYTWAVGDYFPTSTSDTRDTLIQRYSNICPGGPQTQYKTNSLPGGFEGGPGGLGDGRVGLDLLLAVVIVAIAGAGFSIAFSISRPSRGIMVVQQAQAQRPAPVRNASGAIPVRIVRASRR